MLSKIWYKIIKIFNLLSCITHSNYRIVIWSNSIIIVIIVVCFINSLRENDIFITCYMSDLWSYHWTQKVLTQIFLKEVNLNILMTCYNSYNMI